MQGFLIGAYKDEKQLINLCTKLNKIGKVFVHINALSSIKASELNELHLSNCYFFQKVKVHWGSFSHVEGLIFVLSEILTNYSEIDYIHIISGQDLLIKNKEYFEDKFSHSNKIYMSCEDLDNLDKDIQNRYRCRHYFTDTDQRKIWFKCIDKLMTLFQRKDKPFGEFKKVYKGMIWVSAPAGAFAYAIDFYNSNAKFKHDCNHSLLGEEVFFQTIWMNSDKYKDDIVFKHLRYIDWAKRHNSIPAYLDITDLKKIKSSECIFARKVDSIISADLIRAIDKEIKISCSDI